jgi:hypothetical protein
MGRHHFNGALIYPTRAASAYTREQWRCIICIDHACAKELEGLPSLNFASARAGAAHPAGKSVPDDLSFFGGNGVAYILRRYFTHM